MRMRNTSQDDTMKHKQRVEQLLLQLTDELIMRSFHHDNSKLEDPEVSIFDDVTPRLAKLTYGSPEYKDMLLQMKPALDHHYAENRHHPEHFNNGINGMNLVDIMEMLCDWKAASERHDNGDVFKSLEINQKRFGYSDELKQLFINTLNDVLK